MFMQILVLYELILMKKERQRQLILKVIPIKKNIYVLIEKTILQRNADIRHRDF